MSDLHKTIFSGCGHEVEKVIQDMRCPVCMALEIERLRAKCSGLESDLVEQEMQIASLQSKVHLCTAYDKLELEIERLTADCEMKDKRIDWTVADNVKKAMEIERLTARIKELEEFVIAEGECHISADEVRKLEAENERLKGLLDKFVYMEDNPKYVDPLEQQNTRLQNFICTCTPHVEIGHHPLCKLTQAFTEVEK